MISLPLIPPDSVHRSRLSNGLTVLVRRDVSAPVVAIVTYVMAGYFDESDDVVGISHVLEHMFFKGTERRGVGEISRETKAAGGYLNAGTIYDHTSYYTVLPSSGFAQGLEVQADAYANSLIDAEELGKELKVIIEEAKRKADNPQAVTVESLYELLHDRHRMRRWRIGRESGLRTFTREMVNHFYRAFYRPGNSILVIVGNVEPADALRHVERLYGPLGDAEIVRDRGPSEDERGSFRYRELSGDVTQTQIGFGWRTPASLNQDTPLLDLAAAVLGTGRASRLYRAVRERKLAASISAFNYVPTTLGVFVVHAESPPESALDAARAIWAQVRDLRESGVGRDELWRVRRIFESQWIRKLETMEGQANHLAEWEALGDWALGDRYLERLLTAKPEQVTDTVGEYLTGDRCGLVLYRPATAPAVARDTGEMRLRLENGRPSPLPVPPPLAAAPSPAAGRAPSLESVRGPVRVYRTAAGVPILYRRKAGAPLLHVGVYALGGASEEDESLAGLTMLLARTALKGTERRTAPQIAEESELLGGSMSGSAGAETFGWSFSVPAVHADAAIDLLADVAQHATFPDEALATERAVAIADLALLRDDMYRYPLRLLTQAAFAGHPYGVPAAGFPESLANVDAERVRAWHRTHVLEAPLVIAMVGDLPADEIAATAARHLSGLRMAEPSTLPIPSWPESATVSSESREKAQTALALAFPAPARRDEARYAAELIGTVASGLGGRFFDELRDRQSLAYTVQAFSSPRRLAGMFVSYIATSPEKEQIARAGLLAEFAKLRESRVTQQELTQAKEYAIGTHAIRQQSGGAVLGDLIDSWLLGCGLAELEEHDERVRAVTADAMLAVARGYFEESRTVEGIVRGGGVGPGSGRVPSGRMEAESRDGKRSTEHGTRNTEHGARNTEHVARNT